MALTENNERKSERKEKPSTKVIVRRLPPTIDKETFLNQVSPVPDYNYIYIVKGDLSLGENAFSRVYINFVCAEDVYSFKERFDNYVFLDSKGHEYPCVVEFAPFQKIPKKRGKTRMDPKCGMIESDPYYLDFVENLNKPQEQDEKPEYTLQLNSESKNEVTTPLLEYIKNKRAQRMKIREVRREERKRREFDRKKEYGKSFGYDERRYDEKSPVKNFSGKSHSTKPKEKFDAANDKGKTETTEEKLEKPDKVFEKSSSSSYKGKERKYDEKRKEIKPRFPRKEYGDTREYKRSDDFREKDYKSRHGEYKKEDTTKVYPKKVKKYSEKREERKMEAQIAEQKKLEQQEKESKEADCTKAPETSAKTKKEELKHKSPESVRDMEREDKCSEKDLKDSQTEKEMRSVEKDSHSSRRIRNKDRPTIAIYRPGMLSKRKQNDDESKT